eukprot:GEZU01006543.1.p1 GENE.GEZU01006543.1~~GEZU01006543.1.p1  ORF type:complete len:115 (-),score=13.51 GEZU01006543.1:239-583(-)
MSSPDNSTDNEEAKFHKILLSDAELWQQQRQRFFMEQERKHKYKQKQQQQQSETNDNEEPKRLEREYVFRMCKQSSPFVLTNPIYKSDRIDPIYRQQSPSGFLRCPLFREAYWI